MKNNASVIPTGLAKALSDKLYDKQRVATLKVERLVLEALDADDEQKIYRLVAELATDYATSERESARIGGLVALAATAVALTHINIRPFLPHMVPPMVSALSDGESKVRYFACESLYNVAKVSRGNILRWFNDIFDGLARVTADSVKTVKDGADYLDRLIKDIVAEQAATCLDWYGNEEGSLDDGVVSDTGKAAIDMKAGDESTLEALGTQNVPESSMAAGNAETNELAAVAQMPVHPQGPRLAFSLEKFVPLLSERMHTYKPSTRLYLIEWIRVLDSVPGLDLIVYLPEFLDGLLRFLSDPSDDVRNKTQSLLGELLNEVRECVELQGMQQETASGQLGLESKELPHVQGQGSVSRARVRSSTLQSDVHVEGRFSAESPQPYGYSYSSSGTPVSPVPRVQSRASNAAIGSSSSAAGGSFGQRYTPSTANVTAAALSVLSPDRPQSRGTSQQQQQQQQQQPYMAGEQSNRSAVSLMSSALASGQLHGMSDELRMAARRKKIRAARAGASTVPGSQVQIDFARCVSILVPHVESNDQEIQGTALLWIYQFTWLCPQVIVAAVPTLVNAVLPSVSHPMPTHRRTAEDVNEQLYSLVQAAPDPVHRRVAKCPAKSTESEEPKQPLGSGVNDKPWLRPATRPLTPVTVTASATAGATLASAQQPAALDAANETASVVTSQQAPPVTRSRTGSMLQNAEPGSATASTVPSRVASPPPMQPRPAANDDDEEEERPRRRESNSEPPLLSDFTQLDISDNAEEYETVVDEPFNYEQAATAVMELFAKNVHEPTKVAGMRWLLLLHRKAPWRILTPEDMSFPVLLKMLGDSSEQVVKLDLELFAQISAYSQDGVYNGRVHALPAYDVDVRDMPYLSRFLGSLLQMFATDRVLLETRGALMVRQLCVVLDAQLVFCLFARLLLLPRFSVDEHSAFPAPAHHRNDTEESHGNGVYEDAAPDEGDGSSVDETGATTEDYEDEEAHEQTSLADLEFISVMVQHLSWVLVTAPETEALRMTLRRYSAAVPLSAPGLPSLRMAVYSHGGLFGRDLAAGTRTSAYSDDSAGVIAGRNRAGSGGTRGRGRGTSNGSLLSSAAATVSAAVSELKPARLVRAPPTSAGSATSSTMPRTAGRSTTASSGRTLTSSGAPINKGAVPASGLRSRGSSKVSLSSAPQQQQQQQQSRRGRRQSQSGGASTVVERARSALATGLETMQSVIEQNQQSHGLFLALFGTWSHNSAACLTLCLLSQHYGVSAELVSVFGQLTQDLTVSFLVQLDKLVQLIESPVFTFLRLQLLDPAQHPRLLRTLYGLLMLLPQSSAFAILRNRLSTVAMVPTAASAQFAIAPPYSERNPMGYSGNSDSQQQQQQQGGKGMQLHYHYHYHARPASRQQAASAHGADATTSAATSGIHNHQQQQQLCSALGVSTADVNELARALALCSVHQQLSMTNTSHESASNASVVPPQQALRDLFELQLAGDDDVNRSMASDNWCSCSQCTASSLDAIDLRSAASSKRSLGITPSAFDYRQVQLLVEEYKAVRRRHAQALALSSPLKQHPLRPHATDKHLHTGLQQWISAQDKYSQQHILANIAPFASDPHAMAGAVCASPSRKHPDYYYSWTRDSALVMNEVINWVPTANSALKRQLEETIEDYIGFTRHVQQLKGLKYGLGEAKFHMDGKPFTGSWCNAQTDGPALRARTLIKYMRILETTGRSEQARVLFYQVILPDLLYVQRVWMDPHNCDIWEESRGMHFYTLLAQQRALEEGAQMAEAMGESWKFAETARQISARLNEFWDHKNGYIVTTRNHTGGIMTKTSNLDAQVLLAILHHGSASQLGSQEMLATVSQLIRAFDRLYGVNQVQQAQINGRWVQLGAAMGRYPEDVYNGDGTSRGNPWSLITSSMAEYHYRLAYELLKAAKNERISEFAGMVEWQHAWGLAEYLLAVGDRFMARVWLHTDNDHKMYEQWDRHTGFGRGAVHLTWSYTAHLAASRARHLLLDTLSKEV
ncbi:hypothetical protein EV183_004392 [Coemansia sp. RSA 2336]|nr:hypothetical protein EV183_004392 [Coemansia sp. RSA 2336]